MVKKWLKWPLFLIKKINAFFDIFSGKSIAIIKKKM